MKHLALAIAAVLSLSLVAPVFAQPFADVPADHWAFDAIAELAAKGILEGYPDGTFKGDRAMTRYEMAMALARILARIEAVQKSIPPPVKIPPPEVRRADIDRLQRLLNEFRAELSALGVRITAIEEDLAAVRARLDNTRIAGFAFYRYQAPVAGPGGSGSFGLVNLTFTGTVAPGARATVRLNLGSDGGIFLFVTPAAYAGVTFDRAYVDVNYLNMDWRVGRQTYSLGAIGLLLSEGFLLGCGCGVDGVVASRAFGGINFEAAAFRHSGAVTLLAGRGSVALLPGWTFGLSFYQERHNFTSVTPGVSHSGWAADVSGSLFPGASFTAEYATFTPSGAAVQTAYQINTTWDLTRLGVTTYSPTLTVNYKNYPTIWTPVLPGGADALGIFAVADLRAWGGTLTLTVSPLFRPYVTYETGTIISTAAAYRELELGWRSSIARNTTARFRYQRRDIGPLTPTHRYRVELTYTW